MVKPSHREEVEKVHSFTYLESTTCSSLSLDREIRARISRASHAYGALRNGVWTNRHLKAKVKAKVYAAVILPSDLDQPMLGIVPATSFPSMLSEMHTGNPLVATCAQR